MERVDRKRAARGRIHRDKDLVDRLLEGDREAFDRFFEGNARGLLRWTARRLGGDLEGAREVVQSTLSKAVAGIEGYRGEASLFTWLCTCCHYEILRRRKRQARQPARIGLDDPILAGEGALVAGSSPEGDLRRAELGEQVHLALDRLPAGYGEVLELKYLEELSVDAVAARLGTTVKAAESRLSRARAAFKETFTAEGGRWKPGGGS